MSANLLTRRERIAYCLYYGANSGEPLCVGEVVASLGIKRASVQTYIWEAERKVGTPKNPQEARALLARYDDVYGPRED